MLHLLLTAAMLAVARNNKGETALSIASDDDVKQILIKHGALPARDPEKQ